MSAEFSPRAALCTAAVLGGFAALATAELPFAFLGFDGAGREGILPVGKGSRAEASVDREILRAVFAHEAGRPARSEVCLQLDPQGRTFEREKRAIRGLEQRLRNDLAAREEILAELKRLRNPTRAWLMPSISSLSEDPLAPESALPLGLAEESLVIGPQMTRVELALDGSSVPPALRSRSPACSILFFSAPARAGEIAFVETSFRCGARCGEDWLYAVVLRKERWAVAAMARL